MLKWLAAFVLLAALLVAAVVGIREVQKLREETAEMRTALISAAPALEALEDLDPDTMAKNIATLVDAIEALKQLANTGASVDDAVCTAQAQLLRDLRQYPSLRQRVAAFDCRSL